MNEKSVEKNREHCRMREDQQEHQKQMIEILEKVSDQVKRVENMHNGLVPALEGEYYTPPVSQMRVSTPSKLNAPPNLPIFSGQELVPSGGGCLGHSHRGSCYVSCDRVS